MEINAVVQFYKVLHSASGTAPEIGGRFAKYFLISSSHRLEIHAHTGFRILRRHDCIDQGVFIIIRVFFIAGNAVKISCEFKHIISVACLTVYRCSFSIENIICSKMFIFTVAACDVGMMCRYHIPEFLCVFQILALIFSKHQITFQCTDKFRDRCVCVTVI